MGINPRTAEKTPSLWAGERRLRRQLWVRDSLVLRGVVTTTERMFVIRVRNGKAEWVDVRRGAADKDLVEVTGDLEPGDEVVTRSGDEIRAGTPIVPKRQTVKPS